MLICNQCKPPAYCVKRGATRDKPQWLQNAPRTPLPGRCAVRLHYKIALRAGLSWRAMRCRCFPRPPLPGSPAARVTEAMGYQERDYYREQSDSSYITSMVVKLIIINVVVFLADMFFGGEDHHS